MTVVLSSCSGKENFVEYELYPQENIQVCYERLDEDYLKWNLKSCIKTYNGNHLVIKEKSLAKAKHLFDEFRSDILLDPQLSLVWDTVATPYKLYMIDHRKGSKIKGKYVGEEVKFVGSQTTKEGFLLEIDKTTQNELSEFRVKQIGRDIVLLGKNFLATGEYISKTEDGYLRVKFKD